MGKDNLTYSSNKSQSLLDKSTLKARLKMYEVLASEFPLSELQTIIDVGVTADKEHTSSNYFENMYPHPERITALSDQDASWMAESKEYSGMKFVRGNALDLPFEDNAFDLVFSNAVIEHVGSRENQQKFLEECFRVASKYIFITTPNKHHPIEFHTVLPLLHWLPSRLYRNILCYIGKDFFAQEENLNLLSKSDLNQLLNNAGLRGFEIKQIRFLGIKSNLLLVATKDG